MRHTEAVAKSDTGSEPAAASDRALHQTAFLQDLAREWRHSLGELRRALPIGRREQPPGGGWTDIRRAVSPLDSVENPPPGAGRWSYVMENARWLILTVVPVAFASLVALRSKKFRD